MVYYVYSAPGTTRVSPDRMPDQPMQPWYAKHQGPLESWMFDYFPKSVILAGGQPLSDVVVFHLWGVSEGVKNAIERVEPGIHQFIPFELVHGPNGKRYGYYTLRINRQVDPIDLDKCESTGGTIVAPDGTSHRWWQKIRGTPLAIRSEAVAGLHLWQTRTYTFVSDTLHDELARRNVGSGWVFEKQIDC